jgi:Na+-driven multidrug efflux pump
MQGFLNIDDIVLNSIEKAGYAMVCLFLLPPIHLLFCWLLALHLKWGPNGIAIAFFIANTIVFIIQFLVLECTQSAKKITKVSFFDKRTFQDFCNYMKVAGPSVISMLIEFLTFDITIFLMGMIGVMSQASMIIF